MCVCVSTACVWQLNKKWPATESGTHDWHLSVIYTRRLITYRILLIFLRRELSLDRNGIVCVRQKSRRDFFRCPKFGCPRCTSSWCCCFAPTDKISVLNQSANTKVKNKYGFVSSNSCVSIRWCSCHRQICPKPNHIGWQQELQCQQHTFQWWFGEIHFRFEVQWKCADYVFIHFSIRQIAASPKNTNGCWSRTVWALWAFRIMLKYVHTLHQQSEFQLR